MDSTTPNYYFLNRIKLFVTGAYHIQTNLFLRSFSFVSLSGIANGVVHVFAPYATGILILTENDDALLNDIKAFLEEIVPRKRTYQHPANAHSHLRSMLFPPDKTLPVIDGRVEFGTWQSLLFVEADVYPRKRTVIIQVMGEQERFNV